MFQSLLSCLVANRTKLALCYLILIFITLSTIGFVEKNAESRLREAAKFASKRQPFGSASLYSYVAGSGLVHNYTNGTVIRILSNHTRLKSSYPSGSSELADARVQIFSSDVVDCAVELKFGDEWRLCSFGPVALPENRFCLALVTGPLSQQEYNDGVITGLPCAKTLAFGKSGALLFATSSSAQETTLSRLLTRAKALGLPIDLLLAECDALGDSALEAAAANNLLVPVKQLALRTPETARRPLQMLALMSTLHGNGFRQWSHAVVNCSSHLAMPGMCWEQRLVNAHFLTDHGWVTPVLGFDYAETLLGANLTDMAPEQLELLYRANAERAHVACPIRIRLGSDANGYDVCLSESLNLLTTDPNCLMLVFRGDGRNAHFGRLSDTIYEELADKYFCWVYIYHSARQVLPEQAYIRPRTIWHHYRTCLGSKDAVTGDGTRVYTLCGLISSLGYTADRQVDIVELDADSQFWTGLRGVIRDGCLSRVKQIVFVSDTTEWRSVGDRYLAYLTVWQGLLRAGFRTWLWHKRHSDRTTRSGSKQKAPGSYVHHLINLRFTSLMRESALNI